MDLSPCLAALVVISVLLGFYGCINRYARFLGRFPSVQPSSGCRWLVLRSALSILRRWLFGVRLSFLIPLSDNLTALLWINAAIFLVSRRGKVCFAWSLGVLSQPICCPGSHSRRSAIPSS